MKATAIAPTNIAFIKYWGKKNEKLKLPLNGSISVNLDGLSTTTTVEFSPSFTNDDICINNKKDAQITSRVVKHLDLIRKIFGVKTYAKVQSINDFPTASGLASSASGFAALTAAAIKAAGLSLSEKEMTIIARQGSGSSCRSIPDGWVEWVEGSSNESSYASSIFPSDYWDINIVSVIVSKREKNVLTTKGMELALSNPFLKIRLNNINKKIKDIKKIIADKKFTQFGILAESEALELHAITLTSNPPIIYWNPATLRIIKLIQQLRSQGIESYFTIDAGPHPKIICENKTKDGLIKKLNSVDGIVKIIVNKVAKGTKLTDDHLF